MTERERIDCFLQYMKLPDGRPLVPSDAIDGLISMGFFTAPASTKYHGAYEGGLFDHSVNVTLSLLELTKNCNLKWQREESPYIVGMFHDLCKVDQYRIDNSVPYVVGEPTRYEYRKNTLLKGHGDKSVMLLSRFYTLTEEEIMCIRYHMGAFTPQEEWNDYTGAIHQYQNVLWTHTADMMAAHIKEI